MKPIDVVKRERDEAIAKLGAWEDAFGTTQLSHAVAMVDKLRAENAQLAAALRGLYEHDADYIRVNHLGAVDHNQVMKDAKAALKGNSTALHRLLAPLDTTLTRARFEIISRHGDKIHDGELCGSCGTVALIDEQLARLRAAQGGTP